MNYQEILGAIKTQIEEFTANAEKGETNKSAAARARKNTSALAKLMKEYRAISVELHKK